MMGLVGIREREGEGGWRVRGLSVGALLVSMIVAACGGSSGSEKSELQRQADLYAIDQIEATWHKAASTHDVDLMMSLWADNATFTLGTRLLTGKDEIRAFFTTEAAPFKPENHWISETPAYKIRATVNGDTATPYFEFHHAAVRTWTVKHAFESDQKTPEHAGTCHLPHSVA